MQGEVALLRGAHPQAIETILEKYSEIFVEEADDGAGSQPQAETGSGLT